MSKRLITTAVTLIPTWLAAHPGHGAGGGNFSLLHYLAEPIHLLTGVAVLSLVLLLGLRGRAKRSLE